MCAGDVRFALSVKTIQSVSSLLLTVALFLSPPPPPLYRPLCIVFPENTCHHPLRPINGFVNYTHPPDNTVSNRTTPTSHPIGSVISYHCESGFTLVGPKRRTCEQEIIRGSDHNIKFKFIETIWSETTPHCERKNNAH